MDAEHAESILYTLKQASRWQWSEEGGEGDVNASGMSRLLFTMPLQAAAHQGARSRGTLAARRRMPVGLQGL